MIFKGVRRNNRFNVDIKKLGKIPIYIYAFFHLFLFLT